MPEMTLSAGIIDYHDTGGEGEAVVLLHGLAMNGSLWRHVVRDLQADFRCIVPTLPLGGHRRPMRSDVELSLHSVAMLIGEFLDCLDLRDVVLIENDCGRAQTLAAVRPDRIGRLVLVSCEAFDNYPPGLAGRVVSLAAKVPGGINALVQPLRWRRLRRTPLVFGRMAKRAIPDAITDQWLQPLLTQRAIRRDLQRYLRNLRKTEMLEAADGLRRFDRPALVVWAADDKMMPRDHGRRLAEILPRGRLVEIADSFTLIPEDQPEMLVRAIRKFINETA